MQTSGMVNARERGIAVVQVDVFWSYGLGASFALGAWRQLRKLRAEKNGDKWKLTPEPLRVELPEVLKTLAGKDIIPPKFGRAELEKARQYLLKVQERNAGALESEYFRKTLLFLSLLFVPSGAVLLWSNPSWETMQVGKYETIPQWLVGLFSITNVTQGLLGYLITHDRLMKGKYHSAAMQVFISYFLFFFTLANGWDNTGYQRFFSRDREAFENWKWSNIFPWLTSDVMAILLSFGVVFLPLMYYWVLKWLVEGKLDEDGVTQIDYPQAVKEAKRQFGLVNLGIFGGALGTSALGTFLIKKLGAVPGVLATAGVLYGLASKHGLAPTLLKKIMQVDSLEGEPVEALIARANTEEAMSLAAS